MQNLSNDNTKLQKPNLMLSTLKKAIERVSTRIEALMRDRGDIRVQLIVGTCTEHKNLI